MAIRFLSNETLDGTLTVNGLLTGASATFTSATINTGVGDVGLGVYTSGASTAPNVRFGRNANEYIGFKVEDRANRIVFRQDETTGNHEAIIDIWSSTSGNKAFLFKASDSAGASSSTWLTIENSDATFVRDVSVGRNLSVTGNITGSSGTGHFSVVNASAYQLNGTYIVDSSRNLVNIGSGNFSGGITVTGGSTAADIYINNTSPTLGFTDSNSFSDPNDIYIIRGTSGDSLEFKWYDNSAGTTERTFIIDSIGNATFEGNGSFDTILNVTAPDDGGSPAMTSRINLHGYDGRGVGIKMKDNVTTNGGGTDREWFVGSGYNQSGFNIGYAADGSQSSYAAQTKLQITTGGYVGIQTTSPTAPLDVLGVRAGRNWALSGRADIRLDSVSTSYPADILFGHTGAANETSWTGVYWALSSRATDADNKFYFYRGAGNPTGGSEQVIMTLDPNLRVGIGTTSPGQKLQVNGSIKIANANSRLVFGTAGGTDRRALEGNTAGTLLQVGEGYSNTQIQSDAQVTGAITAGEGIVVGGSSGYQIPVAYSVGNGSSTAGAIKIQLPQAMTNTMMMFTVRVYEYNTWEPFDVTICGYNYDPNDTWYNVSAWVDSNPNSDRNFTVRLGYDSTATRAVAYIGELNSTWTYPQVWVTQWNGGHSNQGANWHYGYQVSFETSAFAGITQTITNTQVNSWARNGQNLFAVQSMGSGNVGIGTSSPVPKFHLNYSNGSYGTDATSGFINQASSGRATQRIRSIADDAAELFFDINGGIRWDISARGSGSNYNLHFYPQAPTPVYNSVAAHTFELQQNGNVIVTGNGSSGRLGVHTTNPQGALHVYNGSSERFLVTGDVHVQGSTDLNINGTSRRLSFTAGTGTIRTTTANNLIFQTNSTTRFTISNSGTVTATGDVVAYSDERLKTNIETLDGSKVYKMRGVTFIKDNQQGSGVIAQELEKVAPELVNNESEYKSVAYGNLTGYLIEAIKELKTEIEELKKQIK